VIADLSLYHSFAEIGAMTATQARTALLGIARQREHEAEILLALWGARIT